MIRGTQPITITDRCGSTSKGRPCEDLKQNQFASEIPTLRHYLAQTP